MPCDKPTKNRSSRAKDWERLDKLRTGAGARAGDTRNMNFMLLWWRGFVEKRSRAATVMRKPRRAGQLGKGQMGKSQMARWGEGTVRRVVRWSGWRQSAGAATALVKLDDSCAALGTGMRRGLH